MAISAAFTVDGASNPAAHEADYGATVTLALVSTADVASVAFSIVGASNSGATTPTLTPGGIPSGASSTFPMPADPGDGLGRSFRVKCRVVGVNGDCAETYGVVGAVNSINNLPVAAGETYDRGSYGWIDELNGSGVAGVIDGDILLTEDSSVGIGTTAPIGNSLHIVGGTDPGVRLEETSGSYGRLYNADSTSTNLRHYSSGDSYIGFDPQVASGTDDSFVRLFRSVNTTGTCSFQIKPGDGSNNNQHFLQGDGDAYLSQIGGDVAIGSASNAADLTVSGTIVNGVVPNAQTGTTYTITESDHGKIVTLSNASAITLTVPEDSTEDLPINFQCGIYQAGAGQVSVAVEGTDTVESENSYVKLSTKGSAGWLWKRGSGDWVLTGSLTS